MSSGAEDRDAGGAMPVTRKERSRCSFQVSILIHPVTRDLCIPAGMETLDELAARIHVTLHRDGDPGS